MVFECQSSQSRLLKARLRLTLYKRAQREESGSREERESQRQGPDSESYFTVEYSSKGSGGNTSPLRGLGRGQQVVRTHPRRTGAILGGGLAKFAATISGLRFPLFWNSFLSGICKLRREKEKPWEERLHS